MATRHFTRSFHSAKKILSSAPSRFCISLSLSNRPLFSSSLLRLRPLGPISASFHQLSPGPTVNRCCSTCQTPLHLKGPSPQSPNRPTREVIDGCDFEHWLVVMEKPNEDDTSRDQIIDSYIKTLAMVVGSEEEARMKIYSVSTKHYYAFGALLSEELSSKIKGLPRVRWVLPDSYTDVKNNDYGGEPFIHGQAVPYDPRYHEQWLKQNCQSPTRTRKSDKSRSSEKKQTVQKQVSQTPMANLSTQNPGPNMPEVPPSHAECELDMKMASSMTGAPNVGGIQSDNFGGAPISRNSENKQNVQKQDSQTPMANPSTQNLGPKMAEVPPSHEHALDMEMPSSETGSWSNNGGMQTTSMEEAPKVGGIQSDIMGGAPISRHYENIQNMQKQDSQTPIANPSMQNPGSNMVKVPPSHAERALDMEMPSSETGSLSNMVEMQANSIEEAPNMGGIQSDNMGVMSPPNWGGMPPSNMGPMPPNNMGTMPPNNMGGVSNNTPYSQYWNGYYSGGMQANNMVGAPNCGGVQPNNMVEIQANSTEEAPNMGGIQSNNMGGMPPPNWGGMPPSNMGPMPPNNIGSMPPNNMGGVPNNTPYSQYWNGHYSGGMHADNMVGAPNWEGVQPNNMGGMPPNHMGGVPPNNMGGVPNNSPNFQCWNWQNSGGNPYYLGGMQANNMVGAPSWGGVQPKMWEQSYNLGGVHNNAPNFQYQNGYNGGGMPNNMSGMQANNMEGAPSWGGLQPNNMQGKQSYNMGGMPNNTPNFQYWNGYNGGGMPYNLGRMQASNMVRAPNWRGVMPNNMGGVQPNNMGGVPNNATDFQYSNGHNSGGMSYQNKEMPGPGAYREYQAGGKTYQAQDMPESDVPPPHQTINTHAVDKQG